MNEERKKILEMVAGGKISVEEAERLLNAMEEGFEKAGNEPAAGKKAKYLRVLVEPKADKPNGDRDNVETSRWDVSL